MSSHTVNVKKTNAIKTAFAKTPWLRAALVVGIGGATYMLATLTAMRFALEYFEGGSLIDSQSSGTLFFPMILFSIVLIAGPSIRYARNPSSASSFDLKAIGIIVCLLSFFTLAFTTPSQYIAFIITFLSTSTIAYLLLEFFSKFPSVKWTTLGIWWFAYLAIWFIGASMNISLPIFILVWTAIGFTGGMIVYYMSFGKVETGPRSPLSAETQAFVARAQANAAAKTRRRAARTSGAVSRYGRIPQDTVDLLTNQIRRVTGPIAAALPIGTSIERRNQTVYILLDTLLEDWRENDNFDLMTSDDIDDFQSFIEAASYLSGAEENDASDPISAAIYIAALRAFAQDWLHNWNETNNSGPPSRIY